MVPLTMPRTRSPCRRPATRAAAAGSGWRRPPRPRSRGRGRLLGGLEERRAVLGQQRLVGRDHRRAVLERGEDQRPGRLDAADDLDDHVDVVARDQAAASVVNSPSGHVDLARRVEPAYGDADELEGRADAGGQVVGCSVQQPRPPASRRRRSRSTGDRSGRACHRRLIADSPSVGRPSRSSSVSRRTIDGARLPVAHRDHRRPRHVVVVAGHATGSRRRCRAPRAGRRARCRPGRNSSFTTMSPPSQCLPTTRASPAARRSGGWRACRSSRRRRGRCGCCRSSRRRRET